MRLIGACHSSLTALPSVCTPKSIGRPGYTAFRFPKRVTVYDMVYRPANTALMQQCVAHGGRAIGGLGMLVRQGAIAFELWTGIEPPIDLMYGVLQGALEKANKD